MRKAEQRKKSPTKRAGWRFPPQPVAHAVAVALLAGATPLWAGPTGEQVVAGQASVSRAGTHTLITQGTDRAAINWQSFNIGVNESVRFAQPSASSIALNRVLGQNPTEILGSLSANGQVFILNPNGVLFGRGAQVNVGGLVASTLNLSNEDFMAGRYRFVNEGATGVVSNAGDIIANGGYVAFIGAQVKNEGTITAASGSVALAAGDLVTLNLNGNKLIGLTVDQGALNALAENKGFISAGGGHVLLTAKAADQLIKSVVNNDGIVEAGTLSNVNGVIRLEADNVNLGANSVLAANGTRGGDITVQARTGTLLADGRIEAVGAETAGGNIKLLGHQVGLIYYASVDASGNTGGGTVLVGGDFQGKNPDVQNAFRTYAGPDATITADAISSGDGGKVVVWADDVTRYHGSVSARGGAKSGTGGFVEVSGKGHLEFRGQADAGAANGTIGTILLDPRDLIISNAANGAGASDGQLTEPAVDTQVLFADGGAASTFTISNGQINALTGNVLLQASRDVTQNAGANINLGASGQSLTIQAGRSVLLNASITTNNGAVSITANETAANGVVNADRSAGNAVITMAAGTTINAGSGNIALTTSTGTGNTNFASGDITIGSLTTTGHVQVLNNGTTAGSDILRASAASLITASSSALDVANATNTTGVIGTAAAPIRIQAGNLEARTRNGGAFVSSPALGFTVGGAALGGLTGINTGTGGATLTAPNGTTVSQTETITAGTLTVAGAGATYMLNTQNNAVTTLDANNTALAALAFQDNTGFAVAGVNTTGNTTLSSTGTVTQSAVIAAAGLELLGAGGTFTLNTQNNAITTLAGNTGTVSLRDDTGFAIGTVNTAGLTVATAATLQSNGAVTQSQVLAAPALTLTATTAGSGDFTLNTQNNVLGTVSSTNTLNSASLRDDGGFVLGALTTDTAVTLSSAGTVTQSGVISTPTLTVAGAGATYMLNTQNNAVTTLDANNTALAALAFQDNTGFAVAGVNTTGNTTLSSTGTVTQSAVIAAAGLELLGAGGTFTLNTQNNAITTLAGNTGTVSLRDDTGFAIGTVNTAGLTATTAATLTSTGTVTQTQAITTSTLTLTGAAGTFMLNGANNAVTTLDANNTALASLAFRDDTGFAVAGINATGSSTLDSAGTITQSAIFTGAGTLTKNGTGTLTLSLANTYTGATTISAGTLAVTANNALGTNAAGTTVNTGGTLDLRNVNYTTTEAITLAGGTLATLTGTSALAGTVALNANSTIDVAGTQLTVSGVVSGAGALNKTGANLLILSGNNTYGGATNINAGTLRVAGGNGIGNNSAVTLANVAGAILDLNGTNETIGSLAGGGALGGNVALGAGLLSLGGDNTSTTYNGVISGVGGGISKQGTGTFTLTRANTYSGATSIAGGTLAVSGPTATAGTGNIAVGGNILDIINGANVANAVTINGGTIANSAGAGTKSTGVITLSGNSNLSSTGTGLTVSSVITDGAGTFGITKAGGSTVILTGANTYDGSTTINAGTLQVGNGGAAGTLGTGAVVDNGSLLFNRTDAITVANDISGTGALSQLGAGGTLTLAGNNSYTGATTVSAGTLTAANAAALGGTGGGTTVQPGARLIVSGVTLDAEPITVNGTGVAGAGALIGTAGASVLTGPVTLASASSIGTANVPSSITFNGPINAAGFALTIVGGGNVTAANAANDFATAQVTAANNVSLLDANALTLGAVNATGTISAATVSGNLTVTGNITTTDATANAIVLNAGQGAAAGTAAGGNIIIGGGSITTGGGGRATLYTGSVAGSTGLTTLIGSGSGHFRYNSDEAFTGYTAALGAGNYAVYREQPTVTVTANSPAAISYGDLLPAFTANISSQQNGDTSPQIFSTPPTVTITAGGGVSNSGNRVAGNHTLTPGGAVEALGYAVNNVAGTLTVNQRALTVSAAGVKKTYDGNTTATVNLSDNRVVGDLFTDTYTSAAFVDRNFGVGKTVNVSGINIAGADAGNYTFNNTAVTTANIDKLNVTLTAPSVSKGYDGTLAYTTAPADLTAIGAVLVGGDTITGATIAYTNRNFGLGNKTVTLAGSVISDGNGGNNYNILAQNGNNTSSITAAPLTVTAQTDNRVYDGTTASAVAPVVTGTLFDTVGTAATQTFDTRNVGTNKVLTASGLVVNDGNGGNNYAIGYVTNNTGVITARDISLTANAATKVYGNVDPAFTFNVGGLGLVGGDTITSVFTGALARAPGENVAGGPYAINQGTVTSNANYNVTGYTGANMTIMPRALSITADNKVKLTTDPLPPFTASYSGFAFADNPASLTGVLVFTTPATATSPAGTYIITPSGQASTNYTITYVAGALTVTQAGNLIPTDLLASINSGTDQLPPPNVSGSPVVPSNFAGVSSPTNAASGGVVGAPGTPPAQGATGGINSLVSIINGGVNLPAGVAQ